MLSAVVLGRRMGDLFAASASCIASTALILALDDEDRGRDIWSSAPDSPAERERPLKSKLENMVDVGEKQA